MRMNSLTNKEIDKLMHWAIVNKQEEVVELICKFTNNLSYVIRDIRYLLYFLHINQHLVERIKPYQEELCFYLRKYEIDRGLNNYYIGENQ